MPDREKVIKGLENCKIPYIDSCDNCPYDSMDKCWQVLRTDLLALLKEQNETINDLTDTIRQLNQHIKDLSEYMTPYGKVKDVKAYAELLKEQEAVVRCKDCEKRNSWECWQYFFGRIKIPDDWFCADGEKAVSE